MDLRTGATLSGVETLGCCFLLTQLEFLMFDDLGDIFSPVRNKPSQSQTVCLCLMEGALYCFIGVLMLSYIRDELELCMALSLHRGQGSVWERLVYCHGNTSKI